MRGDPEASNWRLPSPRKLEWEVVHISTNKVRLKCAPKTKPQPPISNLNGLVTAEDIVLPAPRKVPSIAAEYKLPLAAQVARVIEKMKNDFFVVHLCPPGTDCPDGKLDMDEIPKVGVQHGPSSGAGRRRKAATKKKAANKAKSDRGKAGKAGTKSELADSRSPPKDTYGLHDGVTAVVKDEMRSDQHEAVASHEETSAAVKREDSVKLEEPTEMEIDCDNGEQVEGSAGTDCKLEAAEAATVKYESEVGVGKAIVFGGGLEVNPILNDYLASAPVPDTALMHNTKDPDGLQSTPFVDSRHTFLEMCQWRHFQFDTLRRAKHASLMTLYHLHNCNPEDNRAHAAHCAECGDQIKGVRWHCSVCPDFELCSKCNTHDPHNPTLHPHLLTPYRVSYEGELRA